ncbi:hypothetical protein F5H01DRAFT_282724, partial [Linnemannia elongata]
MFEGDSDTAAADNTSNASVAQLLQASKKPSEPHHQPSSPEQSSRSQLPSANNNNSSSTARATADTTEISQGQGQGQQGVSKKRGVSQLPIANSQKPVVPLTPAQQREAEADNNIQRAIELHERNQLEEATHYFRLAAQSENPLGQLMYGLSLRHGWGCRANPKEAIVYLQRAAEYAMGEMKVIDGVPTTASSTELVMALYELGMSYLKGWGVAKDKPVAFTYFKIAADLGDPDSQNETALCYYEGIGIEKDMYESAKYYRMASAQGASQLGNSWIWKPKYDQ